MEEHERRYYDLLAPEYDDSYLGAGLHAVYKRYFEPDGLAPELGGEVLFSGRWFVAVAA